MTKTELRTEIRKLKNAGVQWDTAARAVETAIRESRGAISLTEAEKRVMRDQFLLIAEREEMAIADLRQRLEALDPPQKLEDK